MERIEAFLYLPKLANSRASHLLRKPVVSRVPLDPHKAGTILLPLLTLVNVENVRDFDDRNCIYVDAGGKRWLDVRDANRTAIPHQLHHARAQTHTHTPVADAELLSVDIDALISLHSGAAHCDWLGLTHPFPFRPLRHCLASLGPRLFVLLLDLRYFFRHIGERHLVRPQRACGHICHVCRCSGRQSIG